MIDIIRIYNVNILYMFIYDTLHNDRYNKLFQANLTKFITCFDLKIIFKIIERFNEKRIFENHKKTHTHTHAQNHCSLNVIIAVFISYSFTKLRSRIAYSAHVYVSVLIP